MRISKLFLIAAVAGSAIAAAPPPSNPAGTEGLVRVPSRTLDELYLRPATNLTAYRKVIVDPAYVEMQKGWLKSINQQRDVQRWLVPSDQQRITDNAAAGMTQAVTASFQAQGYEVATAPGPGVLRLTPSVTDLFVNAPDVPAPGIQIGIVFKEAGNATLDLAVRDAVTGTLVARVVDRNAAREVGRFDRATQVSNLFWFDAVFAAWARNIAKELETARTAP